MKGKYILVICNKRIYPEGWTILCDQTSWSKQTYHVDKGDYKTWYIRYE
jgi:hypothetical protein